MGKVDSVRIHAGALNQATLRTLDQLISRLLIYLKENPASLLAINVRPVQDGGERWNERTVKFAEEPRALRCPV